MSLNKEETNGISAIMMMEALGKPPEYLVETLENMIKQMGEEKGVKVKEKKISEACSIKGQEEFCTCFAEVEIEVEEAFQLLLLIFKYMPAHIDVIYPEKIFITNNGWNQILNELARRLHGYDEVARMMLNEKAILEKKLREILGEKK